MHYIIFNYMFLCVSPLVCGHLHARALTPGLALRGVGAQKIFSYYLDIREFNLLNYGAVRTSPASKNEFKKLGCRLQAVWPLHQMPSTLSEINPQASLRHFKVWGGILVQSTELKLQYTYSRDIVKSTCTNHVPVPFPNLLLPGCHHSSIECQRPGHQSVFPPLLSPSNHSDTKSCNGGWGPRGKQPVRA